MLLICKNGVPKELELLPHRLTGVWSDYTLKNNLDSPVWLILWTKLVLTSLWRTIEHICWANNMFSRIFIFKSTNFLHQALRTIWFFQILKTEKKLLFGPIRNFFSFQPSDILVEAIRGFVFRKFMKPCLELDNYLPIILQLFTLFNEQHTLSLNVHFSLHCAWAV